MKDAIELESIYKKSNIPVVSINSKDNNCIYDLEKIIGKGLLALTGNTGVGKSSIINCLIPNSNVAVGETSEKLGRGRHTTRECTLYPYKNGYITDTAGFSSIDILMYKEELSPDNFQFFS